MDTQNGTDLKQDKSIAYNRRLIEILTKKVNFLRAVIYIIVVSLVVVAILIVSLSLFSPDFGVFYQKAKKSLRGTQASLYLLPNVAKYKVGDEFNVDVLVDTKGSNVVVVAAYLSYNKEQLQALSIDLTGSDFQFTAEKEINHRDGKIKITLGKPTPGVNTAGGKIATIRFKALGPIVPQNYNIYFNFTPGSSHYSTVILDDKKGTNILSSTQGANIYIEE